MAKIEHSGACGGMPSCCSCFWHRASWGWFTNRIFLQAASNSVYLNSCCQLREVRLNLQKNCIVTAAGGDHSSSSLNKDVTHNYIEQIQI